MLLLAVLLVGTLADDCQKLDFVNSNASPTIEAVAFTRVTEFTDDMLGAGRLQFSIRIPDYATVNEIRFEDDDAADGTFLDNATIDFDPDAQPAVDGDTCSRVFQSAELEWSTIKDHLTLKETGNPNGSTDYSGDLHYRAEIVVKTTNPYDPETLYDDGAAALSETGSRNRDVTTTFQLYFTLPQFVEARVQITAAAHPPAAVTETVQLQNVVTTLDRATLAYTTVMTLHTKINWPYILDTPTAASGEATGATIEEVAGVSDLGRTEKCNRTGVEDTEEECEQHWTVILSYSDETLCGDEIDGLVNLTWVFRNALPHGSEAAGEGNSATNKGTLTYEIQVTTDAIQCAVDAGDIDVFGTLEQTDDNNDIGDVTNFRLTIRDTALPGVTISNLNLREVGTTQDYGSETRKVHFTAGAQVDFLTNGFGGDDGASAVADTSTPNTPECTFSLNLHQTLFNLDAFLDGSTQQLLVDATAQIEYTAGRRRRRRLMSFAGMKHGKTLATKIVSVTKPETFCSDFTKKAECKKAETDEGDCRWSKRTCNPKRKPSSCTKLGARQCKRTKNCQYKQKTDSCRSTLKVKCSAIADTQELCEETPGCMVLLKGTSFQGCRGTVKLG